MCTPSITEATNRRWSVAQQLDEDFNNALKKVSMQGVFVIKEYKKS